jgi:hypothetical protein
MYFKPINKTTINNGKTIKQASEGFNEILLYTTPNGKVKVGKYICKTKQYGLPSKK